MARRAPSSPRLRGESLPSGIDPKDESTEGRRGEGAFPDGAPLETPPHPVRSRGLDLSPQAGRGDWVLLGEFGRAHGLRGEVRLKSFTADPLAIGRYGPLSTDRGQTLRLAQLRPAGGAAAQDILVVRVEGAATREAAEALNRTRLFVARNQLGAVEEDEFFLADLIGLVAEDPSGQVLGHVVGVPDYGGGELIEISPGGGAATLLIAFTKDFVPEIDIAGGRVVVVPPMEGPEESDERP